MSDSNRRPTAYKAVALPLSQSGDCDIVMLLTMSLFNMNYTLGFISCQPSLVKFYCALEHLQASNPFDQ